MDPRPVDHPARVSAIVLTTALLVGLHTLVALVLWPFVMPLLWSMVLTIATWPAFVRLRALAPRRPWIPAVALSLLLGGLLLLVAVPLPLELAGELRQLGSTLSEIDPSAMVQALNRVPLFGETLSQQANTLLTDEGGVRSLVAAHQAELVRFATQAAKSVAETLTIIVLALIGCCIFYLHGESIAAEARAIMRRLGSSRADDIFSYIGATVRGAAYSVIATAIAQGTLAGIGYAIAGAPLPLLLALTTMVVSLIPFGAPMLYVPVSAYLVFFSSQPWYYGVGLLAWGVVFVSTVDNFLRSMLISHATRVSPIIVFIGVVGGVLAFGLLGVFIGPAIIGVARTLWHDFAQDAA